MNDISEFVDALMVNFIYLSFNLAIKFDHYLGSIA